MSAGVLRSKHMTGNKSTPSYPVAQLPNFVRLLKSCSWRRKKTNKQTNKQPITMTTARHLHERMVDECAPSRPLQHVVQAVLQLSVAFARGGRVGPGSGRPRQRGAQQTRAVRRVSALRGGRLAPLRVDSGESHELHPPVVARIRGHQHSDAAVVGRTS